MNAHRLFLVGFLILSANAAFSQKLKKADKVTLANLKAHVAYLADDRLEGRRAGSAGEQLAMEYSRVCQNADYSYFPPALLSDLRTRAYPLPEGRWPVWLPLIFPRCTVAENSRRRTAAFHL